MVVMMVMEDAGCRCLVTCNPSMRKRERGHLHEFRAFQFQSRDACWRARWSLDGCSCRRRRTWLGSRLSPKGKDAWLQLSSWRDVKDEP